MVKAVVHEVPEEVKPLHSYLPHKQYTLRQMKNYSAKKQQIIKEVQIDKHQVSQAIEALLKFQATSVVSNELFPKEGFIYLEIDLGSVREEVSIRPIQIELPVPIYTSQYNSRIAIFSTDPPAELTDRLQDYDVPLIASVIGYDQAKKQYKDNKQKLKLLASHDLFFCDWRVYNLLRKPLGKLFYEKKKFPFPINCEEVPQHLTTKFSKHQDYLNSLSHSTYLMMGNGPVYTIKIGRSDMTLKDLTKNIIRGAYRMLPHLLGDELDFGRVRQIGIKIYNSPCLPIYNGLSSAEKDAYRSIAAPKTVQIGIKKVKPITKTIVKKQIVA